MMKEEYCLSEHLRVLLFCVRWGAFLLEVNLDELFIKSVPLP